MRLTGDLQVCLISRLLTPPSTQVLQKAVLVRDSLQCISIHLFLAGWSANANPGACAAKICRRLMKL